MGLTKKVLKRPVTTVLVVLCLIVFGLSSIFSSQLELIPEMEMPMLIVSAVYPGASRHQHVFGKLRNGPGPV